MHPFGDLSAYLDGALSSEARASVQAHLDTCALCRTRLAELRGTARLIAALPMPVPSRSLVPRISVPFWFAPLRTFSTFASGAAIFLFLALAVIAYFPRAQFATSAGAPAASQPSAFGAGGAPAAPQSSPGLGLSQSPAPALTSGRSDASASATPTDAAKEVGRLDQASSSNSAADQSARQKTSVEAAPFAFLLSPWLWLVLAIAFGAVSFVIGRRLRSA